MSMLDGVGQCWWLSKECVANWDAWAAAIGVVVGFATTAIAVLAWRTSRRATQIAEEATRIAEQQHRETMFERDGAARVIAHLVGPELISLPSQVAKAIKIVQKVRSALQHSGPLAQFELGSFMVPAEIQMLPHYLHQIEWRSAEVSEGRLHTMPPEIGNSIAGLLGLIRALRVQTTDISERITPQSESSAVYMHRFALDHFAALESLLEAVGQGCADCSARIARFLNSSDHP